MDLVVGAVTVARRRTSSPQTTVGRSVDGGRVEMEEEEESRCLYFVTPTLISSLSTDRQTDRSDAATGEASQTVVKKALGRSE